MGALIAVAMIAGANATKSPAEGSHRSPNSRAMRSRRAHTSATTMGTTAAQFNRIARSTQCAARAASVWRRDNAGSNTRSRAETNSIGVNAVLYAQLTKPNDVTPSNAPKAIG